MFGPGSWWCHILTWMEGGMNRLLLPMPDNEPMAAAIAALSSVELGAIETRRFPDGETWLRLPDNVGGRVTLPARSVSLDAVTMRPG
jgi:hypothetical protein